MIGDYVSSHAKPDHSKIQSELGLEPSSQRGRYVTAVTAVHYTWTPIGHQRRGILVSGLSHVCERPAATVCYPYREQIQIDSDTESLDRSLTAVDC